MGIDVFAEDRDWAWRKAMTGFGYQLYEAELTTDDEVSVYVELRARHQHIVGLSLKVRELWEDSEQPDPRLPTSDGYTLVYCSWHAQIHDVGEYRICVDPMREAPDHPLMHVHRPGSDEERLPIRAIGVPEQWLTAVARLVP